MSRRKSATKREILPDPKFGNLVLAKFMNMIMVDGKKSIAEGIVYTALDILESKGQENPVEALISSLEKVQPAVEVKSRRVGGATYQVPVEVRPSRRMGLSMRWVIDASRKRSERTMAARLAGEVMDAIENRGSAFKKREDTHRMAEANKAFSHFRW
ncbi:MAG: small subunit ribosomal protein S7 [Marinomonas primoryensis]|jgi:small subunit ribosomal protein S7|tara:strand:- start:2200 stop:2670 length:471 start_codon:yes stop_codon:yes gene_type:complete